MRERKAAEGQVAMKRQFGIWLRKVEKLLAEGGMKKVAARGRGQTAGNKKSQQAFK